MTCETFSERVSDWIDGALAEAAARSMTEHAASCSRCRALERSLRRQTDALRGLPLETGGAPDLWARIERRIVSDPEREAPTGRSPYVSWLVAAGVLTAITLGSTLLSRRAPAPEPGPRNVQPVAATAALPASLAAADETLREAREALDEVLAARQTRLSPETVRILEASLAEMENATRQIREALARDPENRSLQQMLVASNRRQLAVMRDVTLLAAVQTQASP
jgi:anti-sigma factor RsiW